jgi:hypothetical protein
MIVSNLEAILGKVGTALFLALPLILVFTVLVGEF